MVSRKAALLGGQGGTAVFAQASGLNLATDFNGGTVLAAKKAMRLGKLESDLRRKIAQAMDSGMTAEEMAEAIRCSEL